MEFQNKNFYSTEQINRFAKAVRMLSYDRGDECGVYAVGHHGSGVVVLFNDHLFFLCTKHSFQCERTASKDIKEVYRNLCFFKDGGILIKPKWTCIIPRVKNKDAANIPEEDILIYLIDPSWEDYQVYLEAAAIINTREAYHSLDYNHGYAFFCGYPNQYGGNEDCETYTVHQEKKGRYARVDSIQKEPNLLSATIDISGLVETPTHKEEFCVEGMSGGGLFTSTNNNPPLFLGMCYAGTVESKKAHFLSVCYIECMLSKCLEEENIEFSPTVSNM
ncbi:MAG: hypothetical protein IJN29_11415 [Akkermansia sp.]|nr:hypothetical protein [Akkermansia sp.]